MRLIACQFQYSVEVYWKLDWAEPWTERSSTSRRQRRFTNTQARTSVVSIM